MRRREFFAATAVAVPLASAAPRLDLNKIKVRKTGKVEIAFDSPGGQPNGLQATAGGLWIMDQGRGNKAHLVTYEGKVIKGFDTETERSSGITFDGEALWIGSTYSREIVKVNADTGKAIERHFTPGAGVIYKMAGDPLARSSPLLKTRPRAQRGGNAGGQSGQDGQGRGQQVGGFQMGAVLGGAAPGTGAHGQEWRDGKLWFVVPPSRELYCIDPKTWEVQVKFPVAGNRPHGIGWEGRYLWVTDSNLNAFFKHDVDTGDMVEKIQLAETDPLPHGMSIWRGYMWYCDDVGVVCRLKMS